MSSKGTRRSSRYENKKEEVRKVSAKDDFPPEPPKRAKTSSASQTDKEAVRAASGVKVIPNRKTKAIVAKKTETDWIKKFLPDREWSDGDVIWARMRGSPYWPSLVTKDPSSGDCFRTGSPSQGKKKEVHVTFFANNAKHSWVLFSNTTKFESLNAYQKMINELGGGKKGQENYFVPKRSMKSTWNKAAKEAEDSLKLDASERAGFLTEIAENLRQLKVGTPTKRRPELIVIDADSSEPVTSKQV